MVFLSGQNLLCMPKLLSKIQHILCCLFLFYWFFPLYLCLSAKGFFEKDSLDLSSYHSDIEQLIIFLDSFKLLSFFDRFDLYLLLFFCYYRWRRQWAWLVKEHES